MIKSIIRILKDSDNPAFKGWSDETYAAMAREIFSGLVGEGWALRQYA